MPPQPQGRERERGVGEVGQEVVRARQEERAREQRQGRGRGGPIARDLPREQEHQQHRRQDRQVVVHERPGLAERQVQRRGQEWHHVRVLRVVRPPVPAERDVAPGDPEVAVPAHRALVPAGRVQAALVERGAADETLGDVQVEAPVAVQPRVGPVAGPGGARQEHRGDQQDEPEGRDGAATFRSGHSAVRPGGRLVGGDDGGLVPAGLWRQRRRRVLEGGDEHLVHLSDEDELEAVPDLRRDLLQIGLVALGQDHPLDAGAVGGQHLLLDAADLQDSTAQRDLAGHGDVVSDVAGREQRHQRGEHGDAGGGTVLGDAPRRHVDVDLLLVQEVGRDPVGGRARSHERQGRVGGPRC